MQYSILYWSYALPFLVFINYEQEKTPFARTDARTASKEEKKCLLFPQGDIVLSTQLES